MRYPDKSYNKDLESLEVSVCLLDLFNLVP